MADVHLIEAIDCFIIYNRLSVYYRDEMDSPPQEDKIKEAIDQQSNGKAPRADATTR